MLAIDCEKFSAFRSFGHDFFQKSHKLDFSVPNQNRVHRAPDLISYFEPKLAESESISTVLTPAEPRRGVAHVADDTLLVNTSKSFKRQSDLKEVIVQHQSLDNGIIEELYVCGRYATLSKNGCYCSQSFVTDFVATDIFWCSFPEQSQISRDTRRSSTISENRRSVCIVGKNNVDIHNAGGSAVSLTVPFEVKKAFATSHGLLLERSLSTNEDALKHKDEEAPFPLFFTLSHPMNEVLPVIYKESDKRGGFLPAKYTTNVNLQAIFVDESTSLLFCYDSKSQCHSLWYIRKANDKDALSAARLLEQSVLCKDFGPTVIKTPCSTVKDKAGSYSTSKSRIQDMPQVQLKKRMEEKFASSYTASDDRSAQSLVDLIDAESHPYSLNVGAQASTTSTSMGASVIMSSTSIADNVNTSSSLSSAVFHTNSLSSDHSLSAGIFIVPPNPMQNSCNANEYSSSDSVPFSPMTRTLAKSANRLISPAVSRILGLIHQRAPASSPLPNITPSIRSTPRSVKARPFGTPASFGAQGSFSAAASDLASMNYSQHWPAEPLIPDICLDHVWTELISDKTSLIAVEKASKAFICEDFCGQKFFCYFLSVKSQLKCLKLVVGHSPYAQVCSGEYSIECKDAAITSKSRIIVVLDLDWNFVLYTGNVRMCYLRIRTPPQLSNVLPLNSPWSMANAARSNGNAYTSSTPAVARRGATINSLDAPLSPTSRDIRVALDASLGVSPVAKGAADAIDSRESRLQVPSVAATSLSQFKPVTTMTSSATVFLRDASTVTSSQRRGVGSIFEQSFGVSPVVGAASLTEPTATLKLPPTTSSNLLLSGSDGRLNSPINVFCGATIDTLTPDSNRFFTTLRDKESRYSATLPDVQMDDCIALFCEALNAVLPKEKFIDTLVAFYVQNNEFCCKAFDDKANRTFASTLTFFKCLADSMGLDGQKVHIKPTCELCRKKAPTTLAKKLKFSEDHRGDEGWLYVRKLAGTHQSTHDFLSEAVYPLCIVEDEESFIDASRSLFAYIPSVFYALHCCHENLKLQRRPDAVANLLCEFLHMLASVLGLTAYMDLYEREYSAMIGRTWNITIDQSALNNFKKVDYLKSEPWSIFQFLFKIIDKEKELIPLYCNPACSDIWIACIMFGLLYDTISSSNDIEKLIISTSTCAGPRISSEWTDIMQILDKGDIDNTCKLQSIGGLQCVGKHRFDLSRFPPGVLLPLRRRCSFNSLQNRSHALLDSMAFSDSSSVMPQNQQQFNIASPSWRTTSFVDEAAASTRRRRRRRPGAAADDADADGMANFDVACDAVLRLRFSATPTTIRRVGDESADDLSNVGDDLASGVLDVDEYFKIRSRGESSEKTGHGGRCSGERNDRLGVVRRALRSSRPLRIDGGRNAPQTTPRDERVVRDELERTLLARLSRQVMVPLGRGALTLRSSDRLFDAMTLANDVAARWPRLPKLCLTGRSVIQKISVEMTHIEVPPNFDLWPQFHNGVAAGLKIFPRSLSTGDRDLMSAWIVSNITRPSASPTSATNVASGGPVNNAPNAPPSNLAQGNANNAHLQNHASLQNAQSLVLQPDIAGFLLGLGLNGLLSNLGLFNVHEYLAKGDPMTSSAILLGVAASKAGTKDSQVMKMLTAHLSFLLPPTLLELNVDPTIQNAAVVALGLLYAQSANHGLSEALLQQIRQPASAQTDCMHDRESYALSCGFALGLILLGRGNLIFNDPDFTLADELVLLINGGHKKLYHFAPPGNQSNLTREGEFINIHVTSLPATVALGLMYLKTNDESIAKLLEPPDTLALLDAVRPDFLLMRTLCKNFIMWRDILPNRHWVESQIPDFLHQNAAALLFKRDNQNANVAHADQIDLETIAQAYCYISVGACFSVAFKFAGSANAEAFETLAYYCHLFLPILYGVTDFAPVLRKAGKHTTEVCLNVLIISLSMVMANTGNLDVLRLIRLFRKRISIGSNYLAPNLALGLLFLGCGRYCLKTDNLSIAAMLCAFYPKFPVTSSDNRYHFQALRHLYVLACERRVFFAIDDKDGELVYCNLKITFKATKNYDRTVIDLKAPCCLAELDKLELVEVDDERYFPLVFKNKADFEILRKTMLDGNAFKIRRRSGFLTHEIDPMGYKSISSRNLFRQAGSWSVSDPINAEIKDMLAFVDLRDYCVHNECVDALPVLQELFRMMNGKRICTWDVWQIKLLRKCMQDKKNNNCMVLCGEMLLKLDSMLEERLIKDIDKESLKNYIGKWVTTPEKRNVTDNRPAQNNHLGEFLTYFDLMSREQWSQYQLRDYRNLRSFVEKLLSSGMPTNSVIVLQRILLR